MPAQRDAPSSTDVMQLPVVLRADDTDDSPKMPSLLDDGSAARASSPSKKLRQKPALMTAAAMTQSMGDSPASPGQPFPPTATLGSALSVPSARSAPAHRSLRHEQTWSELQKCTGEPGDIQRDQAMAYGESALTFKDVAFSVRARGEEKVILSPLSGHFEPGTMVAMMGPSGSGKTTLLDILADKKTTPYQGVVHVNGRPRDRLFRRITTYVAQTDLMPPHLTVKEAVVFHTLLKTEMPSKFTRELVDQATESRLEAVGLCEVKDVRIGNETLRGISGGQRRRVSLACGLASGAQIFFCDEPTSGLSATDAEASVRFLRLVAKKYNVTVIVAIHQPRVEVARLFDHLLLLTASPGRAVYNGPMRDASEHWEKVGFPVPEFCNPTDYYLDLVTPGIPIARVDTFVDYYEVHCRPTIDELVGQELQHERKTALELLEVRRQRMLQWGDLPAIRDSVYGVRFGKQLRIVFNRQLKLSLRDSQGVLMELVVAVAKALVVGIAYVNVAKQEVFNQIGFFFMLLMTCSLDGMKIMPKIIEERTIMKQETSEALYSDWAYIISFTVINGCIGLLSNSLFVVLLFVMAGFEWALYPSILLWTTLLYYTMDSLYLMIAAIGKDSTTAQILCLPFLMVFLLYNGFTVSQKTVPAFMKWALWASPVAYAIEAVVIAAENVLGSEYNVLVTTFGYTDQWQVALTVMVACVALFRTVQVICLRLLNNPTR